MDHFDDHMLDLLNEYSLFVFQQFEAELPELLIEGFQQVWRGGFWQIYLSQFEAFVWGIQFFKDRSDDHLAADTYHVFYIEPQDDRFIFLFRCFRRQHEALSPHIRSLSPLRSS